MDEEEFAQLARECGMHEIANYRPFLPEQPPSYTLSARQGYSAYDEIEDLEDDTGKRSDIEAYPRLGLIGNQLAFSSPCPPERTYNQHRRGTQYLSSQNAPPSTTELFVQGGSRRPYPVPPRMANAAQPRHAAPIGSPETGKLNGSGLRLTTDCRR